MYSDVTVREKVEKRSQPWQIRVDPIVSNFTTCQARRLLDVSLYNNSILQTRSLDRLALIRKNFDG